MKKILLISAFILAAQALLAQNSEKFTAAMKASLAAMDTSFKNPANLLTVANKFERIAEAEKSQWLPYYYAALCQVNYGFMLKDPSGLDRIADRAEALINKADSISPKNSEISIVRAMIATQRMIVNPMQRYMEYGPVIDKQLETAKAQDASNPRADYLKGENVKNTPEQFGGGCAAAAVHLKSAKEKFGTFKPASEIHPNWGMQRIDMLMKECKL